MRSSREEGCSGVKVCIEGLCFVCWSSAVDFWSSRADFACVRELVSRLSLSPQSP